MKKGKTQKLSGFKNCKVLYGTVDSRDLRSIYINLQTWVQPKLEFEKTNRVVSLLNREIKHSVLNFLDSKTFKENFIVDLDLRHSGIIVGKKSFLNLEITLFTNDLLEFKSNSLKKEIEDLTKNIYKYSFLDNEYFTFNLNKKEKKQKRVKVSD